MPRLVIKLDLRNIFHSFPLHPKARFVTRFEVRDSYFQYRQIPMGIRLAPYIAHAFLCSLLAPFRQKCELLWIHIDDILIMAHPITINSILQDILIVIDRAGILINWKKSQPKPVSCLNYCSLELDLVTGQHQTNSTYRQNLASLLRLAIHKIVSLRVESCLAFISQVYRWPNLALKSPSLSLSII